MNRRGLDPHLGGLAQAVPVLHDALECCLVQLQLRQSRARSDAAVGKDVLAVLAARMDGRRPSCWVVGGGAR